MAVRREVVGEEGRMSQSTHPPLSLPSAGPSGPSQLSGQGQQLAPGTVPQPGAAPALLGLAALLPSPFVPLSCPPSLPLPQRAAG